MARIRDEERVGEERVGLAAAGVTELAACVYGAPEEKAHTMALLGAARPPG